MTNSDVISYITSLPQEEVAHLIDQIEVCLTNTSVIAKDIREVRFQDGIKCPHCGSKAIRYGKVNGKQRYLCANSDCHKTFGDFTKSILSGTHLPMQIWRKFAELTILGSSLKKIHLNLGISIKTAFYMRHKLFEAIQKADSVHPLTGSVEIDETYFRESFKGNHKHFKLPREPHTRGNKSHIRGLSSEMVCVAFGVDNSKNIISAPICNGMPSVKSLASFYGSRIEPGSTVHSDTLKGYNKMLKAISVNHIAVKAGTWKNGADHLSHINNMHSDCKRWLNRIYNGVSTKFLHSYLHWFKWVQIHSGIKTESQGKLLFECSSYTLSSSKMKDFSTLTRRVI